MTEFTPMDPESRIMLLKWPLRGNDADITRGSEDDPELVEFLDKWIVRNQQLKDIEVFEQNGNIAATSIGYLGAFRERDLEAQLKTRLAK